MNNKDCEKISWILAQYMGVHPEMLDEFFELDSRIQEHYDWDRNYAIAQYRTPEIYNDLMSEKFGSDWAILKNQPSSEDAKALYKQANDMAFAERKLFADEDR